MIYSFILSIFSVLVSPIQKNQCTLNITVSNLKNTHGNVAVAIFNSKSSFLAKHKEYTGKFIEITPGKEATLTIENLPEGTYAVSAFHDENGNGEMDKNMLGIPTEDYGFSNNAKGLLGPPSFEDASFTISNSTKQIDIRLQ